MHLITKLSLVFCVTGAMAPVAVAVFSSMSRSSGNSEKRPTKQGSRYGKNNRPRQEAPKRREGLALADSLWAVLPYAVPFALFGGVGHIVNSSLAASVVILVGSIFLVHPAELGGERSENMK